MKRELESGGESFESGRSPMQAFCVGMARNGAVVFIYDMVGHSDSVQIDHMPLARSTKTITRPEGFGYGSVKAELHLQNTMGLHTWNSVRIVDWLETLPFVDAKRIAVTGASGGGTQSMILSAIDDRIAVSCPAVMVSTDMQGGCTCENAPYMRLHAGNIDFAAVFAPKPLAMTTADDWTKNMPTSGFPDIKALYEMYGRPDDVALFHFPQFPHNYNQPARESVYTWISKHFGMGVETDEHGLVRERPFELMPNHDLTVWTPSHMKPEVTGLDFEKKLLDWQTRTSNEQLAKLMPRDAETLEKFRQVVGGAMQTIVDYAGAMQMNVSYAKADGVNNEVLGFGGDKPITRNHVIICVVGQTFDKTIRFDPLIKAEGDGGVYFALVGQKPQHPMVKAPLFTKQGDGDVGLAYQYLYTFGYNDSVFVRRVHNIISSVEQTRDAFSEPPKITLVALDGAGKWAALAASQLGGKVDSLVIDTAGFRFENVDAVDDPDFLPGGAKYFDLPGMIALCAPTPMLLLGEATTPDVVAAAYKAADAESAIKCLGNQPMTLDEKIALIAEKLSE
jgi:dienelactone hydrolase